MQNAILVPMKVRQLFPQSVDSAPMTTDPGVQDLHHKHVEKNILLAHDRKSTKML